MGIKDDLDRDVKQFFKQIEGQLPEGKQKMLKMLIEKYCHISSTPVIFDKNDFDMIKVFSRDFLLNSNFPKVMGHARRVIDSYDNSVLSIIEGTITYLEGKDCLKKHPKFDYKEK